MMQQRQPGAPGRQTANSARLLQLAACMRTCFLYSGSRMYRDTLLRRSTISCSGGCEARLSQVG